YIGIEGRMDDVINVSGYRMATEEIEAALNTHPDVAESAVVGMPHEINGEAIYVYCILNEGKSDSKEALYEVRKSLIKYVR
ncbi:AMP-binding enzyme, partial [Francisella tularensis]|uniref:AMP-binding enzyme n=1 Tax=Francisella tularensis TaxID=263 RepID=UPI0023AC24EB|nr:hypothetical protein [Francisella tularensis subsp. holarctica]